MRSTHHHNHKNNREIPVPGRPDVNIVHYLLGLWNTNLWQKIKIVWQYHT